jgi:hypothetical protein
MGARNAGRGRRTSTTGRASMWPRPRSPLCYRQSHRHGEAEAPPDLAPDASGSRFRPYFEGAGEVTVGVPQRVRLDTDVG